MILVDPQTEFLCEVPLTLDEQLKFIELAGRTCYKSEDKITENSASKFVRKLIDHTHLAMVEMSNFVVRANVDKTSLREMAAIASLKGSYLDYAYDDKMKFFYIGGNLTAWLYAFNASSNLCQTYLLPFYDKYREIFNLATPRSLDIDYNAKFDVVTEPECVPYKLKRLSFKIICDRGVTHEIVRHRPASYAQESTRYVCYLKQKNVAFVKPWWYNDPDKVEARLAFERACLAAEESYNHMRRLSMTPQAARAVLPNATRTELIMTSTPPHFEHVIKLRIAKDAHPDAQVAINPMVEVLDRYKRAKVA